MAPAAAKPFHLLVTIYRICRCEVARGMALLGHGLARRVRERTLERVGVARVRQATYGATSQFQYNVQSGAGSYATHELYDGGGIFDPFYRVVFKPCVPGTYNP
jgi:hypothetical protein